MGIVIDISTVTIGFVVIVAVIGSVVIIAVVAFIAFIVGAVFMVIAVSIARARVVSNDNAASGVVTDFVAGVIVDTVVVSAGVSDWRRF